MVSELNLTEKSSSINGLNEIIADFEVVFTGSDQVWNPEIVGNLSDAYTLNFGLSDLKRISYAASIGDISFVKRYENQFKDKLSKLDVISVREKDAQEVLSTLLNREIKQVLDPTLLLTAEEWNYKIDHKSSIKEKYILAYVVKADEEYLKIVNELSKKTGLKVIYFENENRGYDNPLESKYTEGPFEFVNLIKNAEYVVATSFHAMAFSIIYNKKFFIIPHRKTSSRVTSLLECLGIENRTYYTCEEFKDIDFDLETDWKVVNEKIEKQRVSSIDFIKQSLLK